MYDLRCALSTARLLVHPFACTFTPTDEHLTSHKFFLFNHSNLAWSRWENCVVDCVLYSHSLTHSLIWHYPYIFTSRQIEHTHTHTLTFVRFVSFFLCGICISIKAFVYYVLSVFACICLFLSISLSRSLSFSSLVKY